MGFFEAPPPPPEPPRQPRPEWAGAPENVIGAPVALGVVLARTPGVAVAVTHVTAYPTGVELRLAVRTRRFGGEASDPFHPVLRSSAPLAPELFKFGVQFSDGRKATNVAGWPQREGGDPPGPVLWPGGGGGGGRSWNQHYWLWPLPPPGSFAFVCEWLSQGIPLTREEVDARPILEAAERAAVLWSPEENEDGHGGFSPFGVLTTDH